MEIEFGALVIATNLSVRGTKKPQHDLGLIIGVDQERRCANIQTDLFGILKNIPFNNIFPLLTCKDHQEMKKKPSEIFMQNMHTVIEQYAIVFAELQKIRTAT